MFFDTHTHLNDDMLYSHAEEFVASAREAGLMGLADIGCDRVSSLRALELAERFPGFVHPVIGYHPYDAAKVDDDACEELLKLGKSANVVGIGEIGLDYHTDEVPKAIQHEAFIRQLEVAHMLQKPVIIHDRDAHGDTVEILKKYQGGLHSGIIHCFSGSREMARACLDMGFYIAFGGALTFTNARSLPEVCLYVPEDRLLIETDAPYLTPHPLRGKMNEPANVVLVAKKIAELKGCSVEEIGELTSRNACRLYGLAQPL